MRGAGSGRDRPLSFRSGTIRLAIGRESRGWKECSVQREQWRPLSSTRVLFCWVGQRSSPCRASRIPPRDPRLVVGVISWGSSLSPGNLLQPFSDTQRDLSRVGGEVTHGVGSELDGLVVGESRGVEHPGRGQVLGECLERDASRQPWRASEHLDQS